MIRNFISKLYSLYTPSFFMSGGGSPSGYVIERSLRFMAASSQYLSRTPSVAGNRKTWTLSTCVKRGVLGTDQGILAANDGVAGGGSFGFASDNTFFLTLAGVGTQKTSALFRDVGAHYHVVIAFDSTQAVQANRFVVYINNTQYLFTSNLVALNTDYAFNNNVEHKIGTTAVSGGTTYKDGYLSEYNFVTAQRLTPSSFGETNQNTGQWVAKKYTGTYGTNGFYLDFKDGTSTTTLGHDKSGNNNHWTLTNFTRSAGVNDCWMLDVPAGNGGASAVQPSGNYAVLNNITPVKTAITRANLRSGTGDTWANSTLAMTSGKWYAEYTITTLAVAQWVGVGRNQPVAAQYNGGLSPDYSYANDGLKYNNGATAAYGATYTSGDVIGVAYDADNATLTFYKNGVSQGTAYSSIPAGQYYFQCYGRSTGGSSVVDANFGQRSFAYTPPTGFKALCTSNLTSTDVIESGSFTGNASADGPFIWCNGTPETLTINGNAVTWGTHADKLANGFKLRTSSSSYNSSGTNTWTATILSPESKSAFKHQNAKGN